MTTIPTPMASSPCKICKEEISGTVPYGTVHIPWGGTPWRKEDGGWVMMNPLGPLPTGEAYEEDPRWKV